MANGELSAVDLYKKYLTIAKLDFSLCYFGNHLSDTYNYPNYRGLDAVLFHLVEKYHWTLEYVRSLSGDELRWLLREEWSHWAMPVEIVQQINRARQELAGMI